MKNSKLKERFIELRAQGKTYSAISKVLGVTEQTLGNWNREFSEQIARLKEVEFGALYEKFFLTKTHRIQMLGEQLALIKEELNKRDLVDVSTGELLRLMIRCYTALRSETDPQRVELSGGVEVGVSATMKRWEKIISEITVPEGVEDAPVMDAEYTEVVCEPYPPLLTENANTGKRWELTAREEEILKLVAEGKTDRQIGDALQRSPTTIKTHRYNIRRKLGIHTRSEMKEEARGRAGKGVRKRE